MITFELSATALPDAIPGYVELRRDGFAYVLNCATFTTDHIAALNALNKGMGERVELYQLWEGELVRLDTWQDDLVTQGARRR